MLHSALLLLKRKKISKTGSKDFYVCTNLFTNMYVQISMYVQI